MDNKMEKDPLNYSYITYAWVIMISCWGGLVNFISKVKSGKCRAFNFTELIGELCTSAFSGILTFWLCENAELPQLLSAALIGISGHMGSRAIFTIERILEKKLPGA